MPLAPQADHAAFGEVVTTDTPPTPAGAAQD